MKSLKGFSIWIPIMDGDNAESANVASASLLDDRIEHIWDPERQFGDLFAKTLKLKGVAWDVYLLYEQGITWTADEPPAPTFWMHQLPTTTGADGKHMLNPGRFSYELLNLLGSINAHMPWDMAFKLHARGLGEVKREREQSTLEEVLKAVDPTNNGMRLDEK